VKPNYADNFSLYTSGGSRKYLNSVERKRALAVMAMLRPDQRLFALTLAWTGARISEVLALRPSSFQVEMCTVSIRTLKRRRFSVREVPMPPALIRAISRRYAFLVRRRDPRGADQRLWPWHRVTAWRIIKRVMEGAGIWGKQACPRGLRHAFGVATLQARVPSNLRQKWMGHARSTTTDIYSSVCGPEELAFAERFWNSC
jgi:integrase/recombinase XerD